MLLSKYLPYVSVRDRVLAKSVLICYSCPSALASLGKEKAVNVAVVQGKSDKGRDR